MAYELKRSSFSTGDLKRPEYLRVNPRGRVPAIEDPDFALYESGAIPDYLEDVYRERTIFPSEACKRAVARRLVREAKEYAYAPH